MEVFKFEPYECSEGVAGWGDGGCGYWVTVWSCAILVQGWVLGTSVRASDWASRSHPGGRNKDDIGLQTDFLVN